MNVEFRVHTVAEARANARTEVDGEMLTASIPCLEVELTTVQERSGTLTLRFVGSAMEDARKLFATDKIIVADFGGREEELSPEQIEAIRDKK